LGFFFGNLASHTKISSNEVPVEVDNLKQLQTNAIFISPTTYEQRGPYLLHNFGTARLWLMRTRFIIDITC